MPEPPKFRRRAIRRQARHEMSVKMYDGETFEKLTDFAEGIARVKADGVKVK